VGAMHRHTGGDTIAAADGLLDDEAQVGGSRSAAARTCASIPHVSVGCVTPHYGRSAYDSRRQVEHKNTVRSSDRDITTAELHSWYYCAPAVLREA
jgi:hypothetical protein